ncbi:MULTISPECIES: hypothetical protein [Streptomyces]|uniref:Molecular chaperone DnaJ n=1 Tax=Streptomyces harbinensis TaxID=1176198 RepID=A0A1I6NWG6_9ACTN|nr:MULTISPECIES: hypothetical protein [Streptomyces]QKV70247.1 hypothetical protein HUT13_16820 [Streptomyces harbinensis]SFS32312.1 hypothetical protein SAMN05444716_101102 [Streptomyces harbinensis]
MGKHESERPACPVCHGDGHLVISGDGAGNKKKELVPCTVCDGTGKS